MILNKIHIGAFGKLEDYTLDFQDGFQIIYGDNEDGKTTLMVFLRMMFYGNKGKLARNYRKKYQPWSGRTMGGSIFFTQDGHRYCLEREFRGSDATDRVTLRDLDLGTAEHVGSDIGSRFFGLSAGAFERSVFIGQSGALAADAEAEGELNNRLSNLALTGDEDVSFQTVNGRLETAAQHLISPRHVGIYDKGLAELDALQSRSEQAALLAREKEERVIRSAQLKDHLTGVKKQYEKVKQTVDREQDFNNAEKLREYLAEKERLDELNRDFLLADGKPFDEIFLGKINFCLAKYRTAQTRADEKAAECNALKREIALIEQAQNEPGEGKIKQLEEQVAAQQKDLARATESLHRAEQDKQQKTADCEAAKSRKKPFHPVLFLLGIVATVGAVILWFFAPYAAIGCGTAAFVLLLLSFLLRPSDRKNLLRCEQALSAAQLALAEAKTAEAQQYSSLTELQRQLTELSAAQHADTAVLNEKKQQLADRTALADTAADAAAKQETILCELFAQYKPAQDAAEIEALLPALTEQVEAQKQCKLKLKFLSDDLSHISYQDAAKKLAEIGNFPFNAEELQKAHTELAQLNEQGQRLTAELTEILTELRTKYTQIPPTDSLQQRIADLKQRLNEQKAFYDAAKYAQKILTDSFAELHQSYGTTLERETLQLFSRLTDGRYQAVSISPSLTLAASAKGDFASRDADLLSLGTGDQAYLSLRLALSALLCKDNPMPILLDDVLAQYDDTRAAQALTVLKEQAAHSQILFFTCHHAICDMAEQKDIPVIHPFAP
ncbi:MAG: AAA family ATPase [Clostridia bacterium]|nr:AAA family ATPase [Clostridia bacterium]